MAFNWIYNFPEVSFPSQRRLPFKEKLKWTLIILVLFFILGIVPLFGLGQNALQQFEVLSAIFASEFGSIISLGIGPIVTASIVLQLLNGSGLVKFDTTTEEGKKRFHGVQKWLSVFFVVFEACVYVFMGGLAPPAAFAGTPTYFSLQILLVFQLFLGGLMILFMDDVMTKWGFGSGVSLFIAAGVSKALIVKAFNFLPPPNASGELAVGASGKIPQLIQQLAEGHPEVAFPIIIMLIATAAVFAIAVFGQAMKVEIPLSFGRVRGFGIRWPLQFIYTSNIPVILISALIANVQLLARMSEKFVTSNSFSGKIVAGLVAWLTPPNMVESVFRKTLTLTTFGQALFYLLFMVAGSIIFSIFWVQTSGMDARAQAKNIISSGLQIPGFRRDERVLEHILNRYIWPLTVMGAIFVGLLAGLADISGALVHGTSLLLTVMIIYKLYEDIASQHLYDMNPALRKFME